MAEIQWPVSSSPGFKRSENGGRLINAFAEPLGEGARAPVVRRRVPGLIRVAQSGLFNCRGLHVVGDTLIGAWTSSMATVDLTTGTITSQGALGGAERVTIAHNNAATPDIVAVTENGAFNLFLTSAPTSFADGDLPANPTSVTFQNGYFFFSFIDGRIFATGLNAVTVDALHFTTAQSRPGGVLRLIPYRGDLLAMGPYSIEVYQNTGNPTGFPYSFVDSIGTGLTATFAVAGHEEGWIDVLIWVGHDDVVYRLDGYTPVPISTPDVVRSIQGTADKTKLVAMVYMNGPHAIWSISGPDFTWEYNVSTGWWNERKSYGRDNWIASASQHFDDEWIVGTSIGGSLLRIDGAAQKEHEDPLIADMWSVPAAAFPARIAVPRADFDFVVGVGSAAGEDPIETAPRVTISWSDDGANTWSIPLMRELGGEGEFQKRITLTRTGLSGPQGRQWRCVVSDPCYTGLLTGAQAAQARAA